MAHRKLQESMRTRRRRSRSRIFLPAVAVGVLFTISSDPSSPCWWGSSSSSGMQAAMGFVPSSLPSSSRHLQLAFLPNTAKDSRSLPSKTALHMFMGSDGGILGIGGPELVSAQPSVFDSQENEA
jgi:hypothetical protein